MYGPDVKNFSKLCKESIVYSDSPLLTLSQRLVAGQTMEKTQIDLIILSNSPEVNKLAFPALSTATTVGELREKISSAAVTHPPPSRQRLIYLGHPLNDAKKTLKEIFTQDIVRFQHLHARISPQLTRE